MNVAYFAAFSISTHALIKYMGEYFPFFYILIEITIGSVVDCIGIGITLVLEMV